MANGVSMAIKRVVVGVNQFGLRVGEFHHLAKTTDREVDWIRGFHEAGVSYSVIEEVTGLPKSTIAGICQYRRRAQTPESYRTIAVEVSDGEV